MMEVIPGSTQEEIVQVYLIPYKQGYNRIPLLEKESKLGDLLCKIIIYVYKMLLLFAL